MDGGEIVRSWLDESIDKGDPLGRIPSLDLVDTFEVCITQVSSLVNSTGKGQR